MAAVEFDVPEAGIARITLNLPGVLDAIDGALLDGLDEALDRLDSGRYRVTVVTGSGGDGASGEARTSLGSAVSQLAFATTCSANISRLRILVSSGSVSGPLT